MGWNVGSTPSSSKCVIGSSVAMILFKIDGHLGELLGRRARCARTSRCCAHLLRSGVLPCSILQPLVYPLVSVNSPMIAKARPQGARSQHVFMGFTYEPTERFPLRPFHSAMACRRTGGSISSLKACSTTRISFSSLICGSIFKRPTRPNIITQNVSIHKSIFTSW